MKSSNPPSKPASMPKDLEEFQKSYILKRDPIFIPITGADFETLCRYLDYESVQNNPRSLCLPHWSMLTRDFAQHHRNTCGADNVRSRQHYYQKYGLELQPRTTAQKIRDLAEEGGFMNGTLIPIPKHNLSPHFFLYESNLVPGNLVPPNFAPPNVVPQNFVPPNVMPANVAPANDYPR